MVIFRNGNPIKLTKDELFAAYEEQEHLYDVENIENFLNEKCLADIPKDVVDNLAYKLREVLDDTASITGIDDHILEAIKELAEEEPIVSMIKLCLEW